MIVYRHYVYRLRIGSAKQTFEFMYNGKKLNEKIYIRIEFSIAGIVYLSVCCQPEPDSHSQLTDLYPHNEASFGAVFICAATGTPL